MHYCQKEMRRFNYMSDIANINCPTLLMVGEQSPGHPPHSAQIMAQHIPSQWVQYHEFQGAGAPVYNDSPQESYQIVKGFIDTTLSS